MLRLSGYITASEMERVRELTRLRFRKDFDNKMMEALILYEQNILDNDKLLELCNDAYKTTNSESDFKVEMQTPKPSYIPQDIVNIFAGMKVVPINYNIAANTITVGCMPEDYLSPLLISLYNVRKVMVPIYYYVDLYIKYYGLPNFLLPIPITEVFYTIVQEAVAIGASDITISSLDSGASIYYTRNKRKISSRRRIEKKDVPSLVNLLATSAGASIDESNHANTPRYFAVPLDIHHRGRVVVNGVYYGYSITIRVLSNNPLSVTLEDLNIKIKTIDFIRNIVLSREKGLRVFIGETSSGKNTTILAGLRELVLTDKYKIVSVEQPVEILVEGVEQIPCTTDEEFALNSDSLLRCNPDILYFTEITSRTAEAILKASNTGKVVFTSLHANSIADCISRLIDITGMSSDRLISTIQSCVYQELVRDEEKDQVFPINRCLHFTTELKRNLYGKPLHEVANYLSNLEESW